MKYGVNLVDTDWINADATFEGEQMQIPARLVARELKREHRPDSYAGTPPLQALKANRAASNKHRFGLMHIDVSRKPFFATAQRPVLVRLPAGDQGKKDTGNIGLPRQNMCGTRDTASN